MKVAIDIDEVLADTWTAIIRFHNQVYKTKWRRQEIKTPKFWESLAKDKEENYRKLDEFCRNPFFREVRPVAGSQEAVQLLRKGKVDLIVVTTRPRFLAEATEKWLRHYFPRAFPSVFYVEEGRKSEVCLKEGAAVLVEDSLEESRECASKNIRVLLLDCPWNQQKKLEQGVIRVLDWTQAVKVLLEI